MPPEGKPGKRAKREGNEKQYEARVRTVTLPILEIFEHARETLIRLARRTAAVPKGDVARPRTGRFKPKELGAP